MSFMNAFLAIQAGSASGHRQDFMGESRAVQLVCSAHHFPGESARGISHERDVIAQFHCEAAGGLDAYHDAAVHRTAERCRVDGSTDPGELTAAVAPLIQRRELTPPGTD